VEAIFLLIFLVGIPVGVIYLMQKQIRKILRKHKLELEELEARKAERDRT